MSSQGVMVSRGSVLIVEDEHLLGSNLQEYLRRRGWDAQLARTGEHALAEYDRSRPCVVLMDYELPDMDGFQILGAMRAREDVCGCIMMTAHTSESVVWRAGEHQVAHVLHKPFALAEMEQWLLAASGQCNCGTDGA
ncbi:response regulator [Ramlibacter sp. AN1133]|uniref:response regulator n=1 Tax=Ramlibacter sp. AN1133 TaxID=3133429 RepID=UPI0030BD0911